MLAGGRGFRGGVPPLLLLLTLLGTWTPITTDTPDEDKQHVTPLVQPEKNYHQNDGLQDEDIVQKPPSPENVDRQEEVKRLEGAKSADPDSEEEEEEEDVQSNVQDEDRKMWHKAGKISVSKRPSVTAQLIARLVTLTTGRRLSRHKVTLPVRSTKTGPPIPHPGHRKRQFVQGPPGWGLGRWQGRAPRTKWRGVFQGHWPPRGNNPYRHRRHRYGIGGKVNIANGKLPPSILQRTPKFSPHNLQMRQLRPQVHGKSLPRNPYPHAPDLHHKPPYLGGMKRSPLMPNLQGKSLPKMYPPGTPDAQVTLNKITRMIQEGRIPPINFNCNSNNHVLHLVKQKRVEDKKKRRRRKRSLESSSVSWSESEESGEGEEEEYTSDEGYDDVEGKQLPLLKRVEAKDIHALSHILVPRHGMHRPIIHHYGPRILLVCISNTYLQTLIQQQRGSSSDGS